VKIAVYGEVPPDPPALQGGEGEENQAVAVSEGLVAPEIELGRDEIAVPPQEAAALRHVEYAPPAVAGNGRGIEVVVL
jgi:hypothetical protein